MGILVLGLGLGRRGRVRRPAARREQRPDQGAAVSRRRQRRAGRRRSAAAMRGVLRAVPGIGGAAAGRPLRRHGVPAVRAVPQRVHDPARRRWAGGTRGSPRRCPGAARGDLHRDGFDDPGDAVRAGARIESARAREPLAAWSGPPRWRWASSCWAWRSPGRCRTCWRTPRAPWGESRRESVRRAGPAQSARRAVAGRCRSSRRSGFARR